MKDFSKISIFLFSLLLSQIYTFEPTNETNKLTPIPNIKINSTEYTTSIQYFNYGNNLYFSFDFDNYILSSKIENNLTYFFINTELQFYINSALPKAIAHSFLNINDSKLITYSYILENENNLKWYRSKILYKSPQKQSSLNQSNYYIRIKRENADSYKQLLIIKIPILKKTGILKIRHLHTLPDYIKKIVRAPAESIINDIMNKFKQLNNTLYKNNKNKTKNKYPLYNKTNNNKKDNKDYKDYNHYNKNTKNNYQMRFVIGSVLMFIWTALILLYFLVNRRKNTFTVISKYIGNNKNEYMNI